ncbi:MAG: phosphotransferase, partial [Spirochaetales bacterium]|nr:phosphotransferase [Spirochaetales bacterium]
MNEAINLAKVEEATDLKLPNLLEVTKINNRWAIVLNYIEGTPLSKLMEEHPENMDEYLNRMADIHLDVLSRNVPSLSRIKDKYKRKITESTDLTDNIKYELLQRLEGMHNHNKLCHGDFSPSNILILEDGSYAMLDWAHATQGNASADVAKT